MRGAVPERLASGAARGYRQQIRGKRAPRLQRVGSAHGRFGSASAMQVDSDYGGDPRARHKC